MTVKTAGCRPLEIYRTWCCFVMKRNIYAVKSMEYSLGWRHNGRDGVSNHQPHDCLLNRLFRRSSKETSKLRVTGLCAGNSPVTGEFPAQRASNAKTFPFDDVIMTRSFSPEVVVSRNITYKPVRCLKGSYYSLSTPNHSIKLLLRFLLWNITSVSYHYKITKLSTFTT